MTIHIDASSEDIAETVLLPGDPYRAKWAAHTFLDDVKLVNETRGMLGFTGYWKGSKVTVQGSGMGMPSLSIYVNELIREYNAKTLIRIGSTGAMQENIALRDLILAVTASTISNPSTSIFKDLNFSPVASWELLNKAAKIAEAKKLKTHIGGIYSSDTFYDERPDLTKEMTRHGVLAVEMETAELYTLAARYNCRALAILTASDHLITKEELSPSEREKSFSSMVELALETALGE
jgi:purine-nucleoside phosphorylase